MKFTIKATNISLTPAISDYLDKKLSKLGKFLNPEDTYALDLSQIEDSYIIINWELVNFLASSKRGIKFPDEINDAPDNWILKKSIGRKGKDKIEIYYVP